MHSGLKRFLTTGLAALMSAVMLGAPVSAIAEEADLIDHNKDGVIDVFDYVLSKRVSVEENSPLDLAVSDAAGLPGAIVTVSAVVNQNTGFSTAKLSIDYDEALTPVILADRDSAVIPNEAFFPDGEMTVFSMKKMHQIVACSSRVAYTEENGAMLDIAFRIPEDAEPGTVYSVSFEDAELLDHFDERLPLLTKRGKIRVLSPEELLDPPLLGSTAPVTTTVTTVTTTAPAATTAAARTTVTTAATKVTSGAKTTAPAVTGNTTAAKTTTAKTTTGKTTTAITTVSGTTAKTTTKAAKATTTKAATTVTTTVTTTTEETTTTVRTAPPYLWKGIDVSQYQGDINFEKVRDESENKFVMMRAGFGRFAFQEDPTFQTNYSRAKAAGIPVGAYWYSYATTPETARIEAHVCAQVLGDRQFEYPIAFDIEEPGVLSKSVEEISAIIEAFCSEMESMGYYVMLYCSSYYLNNRIAKSTINKYSVWVANYNVDCPSFTGEYGIWQYGIGRSAGIDYDVDVNYCYKDYPSIIIPNHLNHF
ncbi:MAG: glycoside hydrolase family 25 protein [Oscillospiraceae bacterium]|nr:glycoside hydrolase family 25 protein [Oscillospiraceae bacterium]